MLYLHIKHVFETRHENRDRLGLSDIGIGYVLTRPRIFSIINALIIIPGSDLSGQQYDHHCIIQVMYCENK